MKDKALTLTNARELFKQAMDMLALNPKKKYRLTIAPDNEKRSIPANRAYQAWIPAISDVMALTIPETTRYIKLTFGLPILLADEYMGHLIGNGLQAKGFFQLSYEDQMIEMERLPVTRLFDTKMHNRLRDDLRHHYGAIGLNLEYK